jgi:flavin reductase (DIM6/NTAB) family NADH-FMN oxidoreductase RutF
MSKIIWKPGNVLYPVPAVMVSCGDYKNKKDFNIITISWTGTINTGPPKTYISIRPGRHSYNIIKKYKEFVINLTTSELVYKADFCGVRSGRDIDKFKHLNLNYGPAGKINTPIILESPINIECKVDKIFELGSHHMFLSDVVSVQAESKYFDNKGAFHFEKSNPICYSNGYYYTLGKKLGKFGYSVKKK